MPGTLWRNNFPRYSPNLPLTELQPSPGSHHSSQRAEPEGSCGPPKRSQLSLSSSRTSPPAPAAPVPQQGLSEACGVWEADPTTARAQGTVPAPGTAGTGRPQRATPAFSAAGRARGRAETEQQPAVPQLCRGPAQRYRPQPPRSPALTRFYFLPSCVFSFCRGPKASKAMPITKLRLQTVRRPGFARHGGLFVDSREPRTARQPAAPPPRASSYGHMAQPPLRHSHAPDSPRPSMARHPSQVTPLHHIYLYIALDLSIYVSIPMYISIHIYRCMCIPIYR